MAIDVRRQPQFGKHGVGGGHRLERRDDRRTVGEQAAAMDVAGAEAIVIDVEHAVTAFGEQCTRDHSRKLAADDPHVVEVEASPSVAPRGRLVRSAVGGSGHLRISEPGTSMLTTPWYARAAHGPRARFLW